MLLSSADSTFNQLCIGLEQQFLWVNFTFTLMSSFKKYFIKAFLIKMTYDSPWGRTLELFGIPNTDDGRLCVSVPEESTTTNDALNLEVNTFLSKWSPPRYLWRGLSVFILAGQVIIRTLKGKVHWRNTLQQLERVGPKSLGVCLLTSAFVGMAFTIQFVREFTRLGLKLNRSFGGVLALAFSRELSPVVTSIVVAGRIGSSFAAELGTMQVSEQTDTLKSSWLGPS
ncbi:trigalactosyldiacylglycerol 1 [Actinidia rufa]|uniref:Trigalactosyldiacylglycerol 1 n=1 Tax=Actinidia rufa TaxID=165716 RepID=A0A7J0EAX7_9ERIC|nr:trigalactosyldiacylglycerol 1 [Actinidia rufa]